MHPELSLEFSHIFALALYLHCCAEETEQLYLEERQQLIAPVVNYCPYSERNKGSFVGDEVIRAGKSLSNSKDSDISIDGILVDNGTRFAILREFGMTISPLILGFPMFPIFVSHSAYAYRMGSNHYSEHYMLQRLTTDLSSICL